jgi:exodeoxyribonuclease VII large subunit
VLGRGYAIAQREDGAIVRSAAQAAPGDALRIRLGEGALDARVTASHRTPSAGEER